VQLEDSVSDSAIYRYRTFCRGSRWVPGAEPVSRYLRMNPSVAKANETHFRNRQFAQLLTFRDA